MKPVSIILDTGPLVAYLNKRDKYHKWTVSQLANLRPPLLTCEAVMTEACFLMRAYDDGANKVLELLGRGLLSIRFDLKDEIKTIKPLLKKYQDVRMSLADACLVRMSEQISDATILTLDSDFRKYRRNKRKILPIRIPDDI